MIKKTDIVISHYRSGNVKEALRLAKGFRIGVTAEDRDKMSRAYECMVHPDFYKMLGKNLDEEISKGIEILVSKVVGEKAA